MTAFDFRDHLAGQGHGFNNFWGIDLGSNDLKLGSLEVVQLWKYMPWSRKSNNAQERQLGEICCLGLTNYWIPRLWK